MFAMTPETIPSIEEAPDAKSIGVNKAQISVEEIVKSFECNRKPRRWLKKNNSWKSPRD